MGIQNLSSFLKRFPACMETIDISEYAFKIVAVDTSLYMFKFKAISGERWLSEFVRFVTTLRENDVHCLFVYDTSSPVEKEEERKRRRDTRDKSELKVDELSAILDKMSLTNEISEEEKKTLLEFQTQRKLVPQSLLVPEKNLQLDLKKITTEVNKMKNQLFTVTPEDFKLTRKLFKILDVPFIMAPCEAETTCSDLCKQGLVDAVLSEDTDVLAYGSPVFLSKAVTSKGTMTCTRIYYDKLLQELDMTTEQFLDFCVMSGTDYNSNIPNVGCVTAYKLIQEHKNIETIGSKTQLDISVLKHTRVRELFRDYEKIEWKKQYCGIPDFRKLEKFFLVNNITLKVDELRKKFIQEDVELRSR